MNILCEVLHGSRLYRLDNADSDWDFKQIFLPTKDECLLTVAPKNTQRKAMIDGVKHEWEGFSLQAFLHDAIRSEGYVVDALHCADSDVRIESPIWNLLRANRAKLYTRRMVGLVGFCKTQATKYAMRSERLNAAKKVEAFLREQQTLGISRLYQCWNGLPTGEHIVLGDEERSNNVDKRFIEVAGKKLQATIAVEYGIEILQHTIQSYGDRVKVAAEMNEKDLKSLSHSFRTGYQLLHIYKDGGFSYPLPETSFLRAVKSGELDYATEKLDMKLNELIAEVERSAENSLYPEKVDQKWTNDIILSQYD